MASIQKRTASDGTVTWRARIRRLGYPERSKTFERKSDAVAWARQLERQIDTNQSIPTQSDTRRTLAEAIDRYLVDVLPYRKRNRDEKNVRSRLQWWRDEIGAYALMAITPAVIAECRDKLKRERAPATVNRYLCNLSSVLRACVEDWFWLDDSPMRKVRKIEEPAGRKRFLSDEERAALLEACRASDSHMLYPVVVLALSTGMRQGEILSLTWPQVDFDRERIALLDTKNGDSRGVPLKGQALAVMREYQRVHRRLDTDLVFPGKDGSKPAEIRQSWYRAVRRAGLEDFRFHDLRHSAASYLAMNGASLTEIAEILGHKTLAMVKRYSHFTESHTANVVERMNAAIFSE